MMANRIQTIIRTYSQHTKQKQHAVGKTVFQSLNGRDLLTFDGYTKNDIFSLLWIAADLKRQQASQPTVCKGKRVSLVWSNPVTKAALTNASQNLGVSLCCMHQGQVESSSKHYEMFGWSLGYAADIICLDVPTWSQTEVEQFAVGSKSPVICISSREFAPAMAYAELLTLFEKFGFLRRLVIAFIGQGNSAMLNTYFSLLPPIGVHLRYFVHGVLENQKAWENGIRLASKFNTEMKQVERLDDALYRAHTISTSFHELPDMNITIKDVKEMDLDWTLLQSDSFKGLSVSKDFLKGDCREHTLIQDVITNQAWIFQALVVGHTTDYTPTIPTPRFEGVD